ncbi:MAG: hypothetical protein A2Y12_17860 [Planctomycetes bacterium GWF2_42_9]|nr:MAG: hypothetical protein A2Y12_17860 [Planctomycetes bacterium GWF2_42_9]HAL44920.1 hypothetical protein [Phycisphaerales bacterium]
MKRRLLLILVFLIGNFSYAEPNSYSLLQVESNTLHDLQDQLAVEVAVVPWQNAESLDILMSGKGRTFGRRTAVFFSQSPDARQAAEMKNIPVYDGGHTMSDLEGTGFQCIPQKDGMFDLVANALKPAKNAMDIVYLKNIGKPSEPKFEKPRRIRLDDKLFKDAFAQVVTAWYVEDFTGDEIPDLIMSAHLPDPNRYWPDGISMWSGIPTENSGPGCGYDIDGNWLGLETTDTVYWASGYRTKSGNLQFKNLKKVFYRLPGFAVQWKSYFNWGALGSIDLNKKKYLICSGNIDKTLAMEITYKDGDLYCGKSVNLLKDDKLLYGNFYPAKIVTVDIDKDGSNELLLDGNTGRIIVLKGKQIGQFAEIGCLQTRGGDLCVSTLATPSRVDWNGDGFKDLIVGDSGGWLTLWPGTKDPIVYGTPTYMKSGGNVIFQQAGMTGSIQGPSERRWGYIYPTVCDWDEDGQNEIITNNINAEIFLFKRAGTDGNELSLPKQFTKDGESLPAAWRVRVGIIPSAVKCLGVETPCLLYLGWDGDLVLGMPKKTGDTEIVRVEKLKYEDGNNIRLCGPEGHWGRTKLDVADWDGDGDWDVVWGRNGKPIQYFMNIKTRSTVFFMENCGTSANPVFKKPVFITTVDGNIIDCGGHNASVCVTDLDKDGKPDLLIGVENGKIIALNRKDLSTKSF